eukprot:11451528-Karenia_brevis.AAC.1
MEEEAWEQGSEGTDHTRLKAPSDSGSKGSEVGTEIFTDDDEACSIPTQAAGMVEIDFQSALNQFKDDFGSAIRSHTSEL